MTPALHWSEVKANFTDSFIHFSAPFQLRFSFIPDEIFYDQRMGLTMADGQQSIHFTPFKRFYPLPWFICSNRDSCQIKWTISLAYLFKYVTVTRITSKEKSVLWTND